VNTLNVCSRRRTGATGLVAPRAGSIAHHRTAAGVICGGRCPPCQLL